MHIMLNLAFVCNMELFAPYFSGSRAHILLSIHFREDTNYRFACAHSEKLTFFNIFKSELVDIE